MAGRPEHELLEFVALERNWAGLLKGGLAIRIDLRRPVENLVVAAVAAPGVTMVGDWIGGVGADWALKKSSLRSFEFDCCA